jgi:hypothetical protein
MTESVELLLKSKAPMLSRDREGNTALHAAMITRVPGMVEIFAKFTFPFIEANANGQTVAHLAIYYKDLALVKFLGTPKFNVNWNVIDSSGLTPLMIARNLGLVPIEEKLKSFGAMVQAPPPLPPSPSPLPPPPAANMTELHQQIQAGDSGDCVSDRKRHRRHKVQEVEGDTVAESQTEEVHEGGADQTADVARENVTECVPDLVEIPQQLQGRSKEMSQWVVDLRSFDLVRTVKSGSQIATEIRRHRSTGVEIEVKCFPQMDGSNEQVFFREIEALVRLNHPCIVPFFGYVLKTRIAGPMIATYFMSGGSLRDLLKSPPDWWDGTTKSIIVTGIVAGMTVIHDSCIIHRNLDPSTVLLDADRRPRICDFGSSRDQCLNYTLTGRVGAPSYMAPELYDDDDYNEKVDIYSFALMLYEVVVGRPVFPRTLTLGCLMRKVLNGERAEVPGGVENIVEDLIQRGWSHNKNDRPSFSEIYDKLRQNGFCVDREGFNPRAVASYVEWVGTAASE